VSDASRRVPLARLAGGRTQRCDDDVAVEEPLEVRLHGRPFATIMRTPGADRDLAAGFLLSEGVVTSADDLGAVEHCRHPDYPHHHNVVDVYLAGSARATVEARLAARRNIVATSSCGLCGRVTIESLRTRLSAVPRGQAWPAVLVGSLPEALSGRQPLFARTGGLHGAGLFTREGECLAAAEDVGRHNAVDKVAGRLLLEDRLPVRDGALVVSGRVSFEIVLKAWAAGAGVLCAVSAPSSLAIDTAEAAGITLVAFTRGSSFNVYTHRERLAEV
jgi:FdhD protein